MYQNTVILICLVFAFNLFTVNCSATAMDHGDADNELKQTAGSEQVEDIEGIIKNIEVTVVETDKARREGIIPTDYVEDSYSQIINKLEHIRNYIKDLTNSYKFLNAFGIERIIISNIGINDDQILKELLLIIKTLFDVAPTETKAKMPIGIVDKLLDVFENRDDITLKVIALEILYAWLPNNPKIQARVMEIKGLEPFYHQMQKLDENSLNKLLDLFNIILKEHMSVRVEKKTKYDNINLKLYQMIGLIERMSTPIVCNGLLNLFETSIYNGKMSEPVYNLIKNVQQYCFPIYKGKHKAIKLFTNIHETLSNENKPLLDLNFNITAEKEQMKNYIDELKAKIRIEL